MAVSIGTQLKRARTELNLSQAEVAESLMITRQTLSKWELDKSLPDLASLKQLAVLYDLSLDALFEITEEKIQMLSTFSQEALIRGILSDMCGENEPSCEQTTFILKEVISPLSQFEWPDQVVWYATDKQIILPNRYYMPNHGVTTHVSKACQALFPGYNYKIFLATKTRLIFFNLYDWFETRQVTSYQLSTMNFFAVGKMYDVKMVLGNSAGMCYKSESGNFDLISLKSDEAENLKEVLRVLDSKRTYFIELEKISLTDFFKKYGKKGYREK